LASTGASARRVANSPSLATFQLNSDSANAKHSFERLLAASQDEVEPLLADKENSPPNASVSAFNDRFIASRTALAGEELAQVQLLETTLSEEEGVLPPHLVESDKNKYKGLLIQ
jgi:hypothetical protein